MSVKIHFPVGEVNTFPRKPFKVSGTRSLKHFTATVQPRRNTSRENGIRLWWMTTAANLEQKFQKTVGKKQI